MRFIAVEQCQVAGSMHAIDQLLLITKARDVTVEVFQGIPGSPAEIGGVWQCRCRLSLFIRAQWIDDYASLLSLEACATTCPLNQAIRRCNLAVQRLHRDIQSYLNDLRRDND